MRKKLSKMHNSSALTPTLEDYLETMARLIVAKGSARVCDIAAALSVHKSTVTTALQSLGKKKLISYSPYEKATLTVLGRDVARQIVRQHEVVSRFLSEVLSVPKDVAEQNACRIEHAIDREVFDRLLRFVEFVKECPRGGKRWIRGFAHSCEEGLEHQKCERCLELCLDEFRSKSREQKHQQTKEKNVNAITLDQLKPGQKGRIKRVEKAGPVIRRIIDMGIIKGTPIEVIKVAPLGDPIEVKVKGYNLSLRKEEAANITVESKTDRRIITYDK